jgi:hypothetical protein
VITHIERNQTLDAHLDTVPDNMICLWADNNPDRYITVNLRRTAIADIRRSYREYAARISTDPQIIEDAATDGVSVEEVMKDIRLTDIIRAIDSQGEWDAAMNAMQIFAIAEDSLRNLRADGQHLTWAQIKAVRIVTEVVDRKSGGLLSGDGHSGHAGRPASHPVDADAVGTLL